MLQGYDSQQTILRAFTILHHLREDKNGEWGGALVLACGLNPGGASFTQAANIAGAVCLSLEDDPVAIKAAIRSGACDFVVNTLDEALRAIKNELRKRQPLSIGLEGNMQANLGELLDRGVSPQLCANLSDNPTCDEALSHFQQSGALLADFTGHPPENQPPILDAQALLVTLIQAKNWQLETFTFSTPAAQRVFDTGALAILPAEDHLRRRWLLAAPRILRRERPLRRLLWLTEEEKQLLKN
jgi:urocanate hydratase